MKAERPDSGSGKKAESKQEETDMKTEDTLREGTHEDKPMSLMEQLAAPGMTDERAQIIIDESVRLSQVKADKVAEAPDADEACKRFFAWLTEFAIEAGCSDMETPRRFAFSNRVNWTSGPKGWPESLLNGLTMEADGAAPFRQGMMELNWGAVSEGYYTIRFYDEES